MELTEKQMRAIIKANSKVADCYKQLSNAQNELWNIEKGLIDCNWRNTKMSYWKDICEKYPEEKLLNCYGDIFYIYEKETNWDTYYIGRRVLWNLDLSEEYYEITERIEFDSEGDYADYEIKVVLDEARRDRASH